MPPPAPAKTTKPPVSLATASRLYAFDALRFAREVLRWNPDPKQAIVLSSQARRVILNCARQWGKSTVVAARIVWVAVTRPGRVILVISENMDQCAEVFLKIDKFLIRAGVATKKDPGKKLGRVLIANGSRIVGLAAREAAVRGYTADFVFIDEAARIDDEVIDAFAPVIAIHKGDWWMASTPMGKRGRFWEMWEYGDPQTVLKMSAHWTDNPRLDPNVVAQARRDWGDSYVAQEYECQFVENGIFVFAGDQVRKVVVK